MKSFLKSARSGAALVAIAAAISFGAPAQAADGNTALINRMIQALDYVAPPPKGGGHYQQPHYGTPKPQYGNRHYGNRPYGHNKRYVTPHYDYTYYHRSPSLDTYRGNRPDYGVNAPRGYGFRLDVYFEFGSARFTHEAKDALDSLGYALQSPKLAGRAFLIAGHTDAVGTRYSNQLLAEKRAIAVKSYLVEYHGIDPRRLVAVGFGEDRPANEIDPYSGENRRVEVKPFGPEFAGYIDGYRRW